MLVVRAFKSTNKVPRGIRNRWNNCLILLSIMNFVVTHIYREDNTCADALANIGLSLNSFVYYYTIHVEVRSDYDKSKIG